MPNRIPQLLFILALALIFTGYGMVIGLKKIFPYHMIVAGLKTGRVIVESAFYDDVGKFMAFTPIDRRDAGANRVNLLDAHGIARPVLFYGGRYQFTDLCPGEGCVAVTYTAAGEVGHAYPYRPEAIFGANITHDFPYETNGFVFAQDARPTGISQYPNGDLSVVFQNDHTFPYGGGIARVGRDGYPKWFRWDYSHHWQTLLDGDTVIVPSFEIGSRPLKVKLKSAVIDLPCDSGKPYLDRINILDGRGTLQRQISVTEALLASPFRGVLQHTTDPCDPVHLNYVDILKPDAGEADGLAPGDFVVSLRNLSAFGIIDPQSGEFKRLVRGTFFQQHSVRHWEKGRFIMFDNHGGDPAGGPSRLLMVDLATGRETTLFPNSQTPAALKDLFSSRSGKIDISPDRRRVIATFSDASTAVEVRLADGEVTGIFTSLHDVSALTRLADERHTHSARFRLYGVDYANQP